MHLLFQTVGHLFEVERASPLEQHHCVVKALKDTARQQGLCIGEEEGIETSLLKAPALSVYFMPHANHPRHSATLCQTCHLAV